METSFNAFRVFEEDSGQFIRRIESRQVSDLPAGSLTIRVTYSGLNYKDALSAYGNKGVTRHYPHTPGIDAAGVVTDSLDGTFRVGDEVIVTSYDLGMNTDGGFGEYIRVPSDWALPLPAGLSMKESMILGTAGLTAAQAIYELTRNGIQPDHGPILVTGARGGVGNMAIAILNKLGYEVWAAVSQASQHDEPLFNLGAHSVIDSTQTIDHSGRALLKATWAGVIDVIGGEILSTAMRSTLPNGVVVVIGNVESGEFQANVYPFILRAIKMIGVGTQNTAMPLRKQLWDLLASEWKPNNLTAMSTEIGLNELEQYLNRMIHKKSRGKVLLSLI